MIERTSKDANTIRIYDVLTHILYKYHDCGYARTARTTHYLQHSPALLKTALEIRPTRVQQINPQQS